MIAVIDHIHGPLCLLVLLILAVQYGLDRFKLPLNMAGFPLRLIRIKHCQPSQIHQGSNIKYLRTVPSGKRHADRQESQIADRKNEQRRHHSQNRFFACHCKFFISG